MGCSGPGQWRGDTQIDDSVRPARTRITNPRPIANSVWKLETPYAQAVATGARDPAGGRENTGEAYGLSQNGYGGRLIALAVRDRGVSTLNLGRQG